MEKFEVCFELGDRAQQPQQQPKKDFWERESVITSYLPEQPPSSDFNPGVWADECPKGTSELCRDYTFNIIPRKLVSRLLVRLHPKMEEVLWKNGLFLESHDHGVKVLMRANIKENRLVIAVRGAEMTVAKEIMSRIAAEIVTVSKNYAGIEMDFQEREVNEGPEDATGISGIAPYEEKETMSVSTKNWWELTPSAEWGIGPQGSSEIPNIGAAHCSLLRQIDRRRATSFWLNWRLPCGVVGDHSTMLKRPLPFIIPILVRHLMHIVFFWQLGTS